MTERHHSCEIRDAVLGGPIWDVIPRNTRPRHTVNTIRFCASIASSSLNYLTVAIMKLCLSLCLILLFAPTANAQIMNLFYFLINLIFGPIISLIAQSSCDVVTNALSLTSISTCSCEGSVGIAGVEAECKLRICARCFCAQLLGVRRTAHSTLTRVVFSSIESLSVQSPV